MAKKPADDAAKKTQLSKKSPQTTMMQPPSAKPKSSPKLSLDDDVMNAVPADSGVVEAEAASDVVDAVAASDVVEAQPASDAAPAAPVSDVIEVEALDDLITEPASRRRPAEATPVAGDDADVFAAEPVEDAAEHAAPETPVRAEAVEAADDDEPPTSHDEDAIGGEIEMGGAESSIRVKRGRRPDVDETDLFDSTDKPAQGLDQTVSLDELAEAGSSVNLGAKAYSKQGSSHSGIDEVAEALESGVNLEAVDAYTRKHLDSSAEFDDLFTEEDAASDSSSGTKKSTGTGTDPDVALDDAHAAAGKAAAAGEEADLWGETAAPPEEDHTPATPAPKKKGKQTVPAVDADAGLAEDDPDRQPARKPPSRPAPTPTKSPVPPVRGGRGRLLIGTFLGILLAVGAVVGVRYYDANLLEDGLAQLPGASKPTPPPDLKAQASINSLRDEVAKANSDKDELQKDQEQKLQEIKTLNAAVATLKDTERAVTEVRNVLAKNMLVGDKADAAELSKAVTQALSAMEQKEALVLAMEKELQKSKHLSDKDKLDLAAFGKIFKDLNEQQAALAEVNKTLEDAQVKDPGKKGIDQILTAKNDLDAKYKAIGKILAGEKKGEDAKGLQDLLTERNQLKTKHDALDEAVKTAAKDLADGKLAPVTGDQGKDLIAGVKAARSRAESPLAAPLTGLANQLGSVGGSSARVIGGMFDAGDLLAKLSYYMGREALIQSPEQRLDTDLSIFLDRNQTDPAKLTAALKNAEWVLSKESQSSAEARAKALAVTGLILRNQKKLPQAKQALTQAVGGSSSGAWVAQAKEVLAELNDPATYWLPRVEQLQNAGKTQAAQQELNAALQALPTDGKLMVQRGMLRLEEARTSGDIAGAQAAIRQDAAAAQKDAKTAAEAVYLLGLLEEEMGNIDEATKLFRQALKAHQGSEANATRYRIALARVLLRDRDTFVAPAPTTPKVAPNPTSPKKEEKKDADAEEVSQAFPLALVLLVGATGGDDDAKSTADDARLKESIDLAKLLIESGDPKVQGEGYMILGKALAKQGNRNEGVLTYVKGLKMKSPGIAAKDMETLIKEHPAFQQPDATKPPSAYLAEVHFGKGLHFYWARLYPEAESHFKQAAGYFGQDARYQYYLGLAQMAQKSKVKQAAANFSFEQGAKLEAANRPPASEINTALERIQGDMRRTINGYRLKAIELRD